MLKLGRMSSFSYKIRRCSGNVRHFSSWPLWVGDGPEVSSSSPPVAHFPLLAIHISSSMDICTVSLGVARLPGEFLATAETQNSEAGGHRRKHGSPH